MLIQMRQDFFIQKSKQIIKENNDLKEELERYKLREIEFNKCSFENNQYKNLFKNYSLSTNGNELSDKNNERFIEISNKHNYQNDKENKVNKENKNNSNTTSLDVNYDFKINNSTRHDHSNNLEISILSNKNGTSQNSTLISSTENLFLEKCKIMNTFDTNIPICTYVYNIVEKHNLNLNLNSHRILLKQYTSMDCIKKMKSNGVCDKINRSIDMLLRKMYREIKDVTDSCKIDFLPRSLTKDSICSSEILKIEISSRLTKKGIENGDKCLENYCFNCCNDNMNNLYSIQCDFCLKIK